jgi:hypothetical protein
MEFITAVEQKEVAKLLFSLAIAGFGLFIQECMKPNMILRRYYLWLTYHWIKNWRKKDRWKRWLLKPLGLCIFCNVTWIAIIFYFLTSGCNILIIPFLGLVFLWTKLFYEKIFTN